MAVRGRYLVLVAALAVCGCASPLASRAIDGNMTLLVSDEEFAPGLDFEAEAPPRPPAEPSGSYIAIGDSESAQTAQATASPVVPRTELREAAPLKQPSTAQFVSQPILPAAADEPAEIIATPAPAPRPRFKDEADESGIDRFSRQIADVPVDIRPTEGALPEDLAAEKFSTEPTIDETFPSDQPADVFCSYTPWTICFRPLYFEDIGLERYGKNVGVLQTGLSGARFFTSVAALPYKMTRRPPRSCECSNGFSRPGDCPLPGYGNRRFEWDAALVEAAAVTAFVYIIP